jgi:hypothetical protein
MKKGVRASRLAKRLLYLDIFNMLIYIYIYIYTATHGCGWRRECGSSYSRILVGHQQWT